MSPNEILQALRQKKISAEQAFRLIKAAETAGTPAGPGIPTADDAQAVRDWVYASCEQGFRLPREQIAGSASFIDLGANSLLLQELIRKVEARFGLLIRPHQFSTALATVDGLVAFIQDQIQARQLEPFAERSRSEPPLASTPLASTPLASTPLSQRVLARLTAPSPSPAAQALSGPQRQFIERLIAEFVAATPGSKRLAEQAGTAFSDQRSGWFFTPELKEIHYPIVFAQASGAYVTDIDGNEYLDLSGDFGVNLFGHGDGEIQAALIGQIQAGLS
ncbi:MAG: phosphopantetheine-binding protein, partial [Gammaproteobacteria bacterium SHHR-1]